MRVVVVIGDIEVEVPRDIMEDILWQAVVWFPETPEELQRDTVAWMLLGLLRAGREVEGAN